MTTRALNLKQRDFLDAYLADPSRDITSAYLTAYPASSRRSANVSGRKLLNDPRVKPIVDKREADLRARNPLVVEDVLAQLAELVRADPRDLVEFRRGACRFCHGASFQYQRTPQEMRDHMRAYKKEQGASDPHCLHMDLQGGVGFNPNKPPHADCPECFGRGEGYTYVKDLRDIPAAAARLFSSVEETQHGIKIRLRSQDKNLEMAFRHLGLLSGEIDKDGDVPPAATVTFTQVDASQ